MEKHDPSIPPPLGRVGWLIWCISVISLVGLIWGAVQIPVADAPVFDIPAATVRIEMDGGGIGTGFIVSPEGTVITAGHMFWGRSRRETERKSGTVIFADGNRVQFSLSYAECKGNKDYAFLQLPEADEPYPVAPIANMTGELEPGDEVWTVGNPLKQERHYSYGHVGEEIKRNQNKGRFDIDLNPGNSGGPIVRNGRVIGIVMSGLLYTDICFANLITDDILKQLEEFKYVASRFRE